MPFFLKSIPLTILAFAALGCVPQVYGTYHLQDTVIGSGFNRFFDWEAITDPTHGRVKYVSQTTSQAQNLTYSSGGTFILRADFKSVLNPNGAGRNSVRIMSKKAYTTHVAVFDVRHVPQGCGTWPAIWETKSSNWPNGGEIDILEGVNDQGPNLATLHTSYGCTMPASRVQTGQNENLDCSVSNGGNTGCGVKFPSSNSFGPAFNAAGGGWYALERTSDHIKIFFWSRKDPSVPLEVREGLSTISPSNWGTPVAFFPNNMCDISQHFQEHKIIINIAFCGDWAGSVYGDSGCPGSCIDYVNKNPSAFKNAFFDFASIRVYQ